MVLHLSPVLLTFRLMTLYSPFPNLISFENTDLVVVVFLCQGKELQVHVSLYVIVGVRSNREIRPSDGDSAKVISDSFRSKVGSDESFLALGRQSCDVEACGICESSAKAEHGLVLVGGIHSNRGSCSSYSKQIKRKVKVQKKETHGN